MICFTCLSSRWEKKCLTALQVSSVSKNWTHQKCQVSVFCLFVGSFFFPKTCCMGWEGGEERGEFSTRTSLMNRMLKASEQGKAKQCFDVKSCSSLHRIHAANKRFSGFSPIQPTLFEQQQKNILKNHYHHKHQYLWSALWWKFPSHSF